MLANLQHLLIQNSWLRIFFDIIYIALPVLLVLSCIKNNKLQTALAIGTAFFNIVYCSFFSTMSFVSVENFTAWMIIPLIFSFRSVNGFYYLMQAARLIFIIIFFSAALWKIRAGGVFNIEEMSVILFRQHASYLANNNSNWYSLVISYLINHQLFSYYLYLFAVVAEFIFVIGFFTKKYDKYLIVSFCLFACFDYMLIGINYFTWLPFMACFYLSGYRVKK